MIRPNQPGRPGPDTRPAPSAPTPTPPHPPDPSHPHQPTPPRHASAPPAPRCPHRPATTATSPTPRGWPHTPNPPRHQNPAPTPPHHHQHHCRPTAPATSSPPITARHRERRVRTTEPSRRDERPTPAPTRSANPIRRPNPPTPRPLPPVRSGPWPATRPRHAGTHPAKRTAASFGSARRRPPSRVTPRPPAPGGSRIRRPVDRRLMGQQLRRTLHCRAATAPANPETPDRTRNPARPVADTHRSRPLRTLPPAATPTGPRLAHSTPGSARPRRAESSPVELQVNRSTGSAVLSHPPHPRQPGPEFRRPTAVAAAPTT